NLVVARVGPADQERPPFGLSLGTIGHRLHLHRLAVHEQLHSLAIVGHGQVVPLAVADVHAGADIALGRARGAGAAITPTRVGVDLPVLATGLRVGRDEDVEVTLREQLRPAFDRERRLAVAIVALDARWAHAGVEGLAEFPLRERQSLLDRLRGYRLTLARELGLDPALRDFDMGGPEDGVERQPAELLVPPVVAAVPAGEPKAATALLG